MSDYQLTATDALIKIKQLISTPNPSFTLGEAIDVICEVWIIADKALEEENADG